MNFRKISFIIIFSLLIAIIVPVVWGQNPGGPEHRAKIKEVVDFLENNGFTNIRSHLNQGELSFDLSNPSNGKVRRWADVAADKDGRRYVFQVGLQTTQDYAVARERRAAFDILAEYKVDLRFVPYNAQDGTWKASDGSANREKFLGYPEFQPDLVIDNAHRIWSDIPRGCPVDKAAKSIGKSSVNNENISASAPTTEQMASELDRVAGEENSAGPVSWKELQRSRKVSEATIKNRYDLLSAPVEDQAKFLDSYLRSAGKPADIASGLRAGKYNPQEIRKIARKFIVHY